MNRNMLLFCWVAFANVLCGTHAVLKTFFIDDLCFMRDTVNIDLSYQKTGILMAVPSYRNNFLKCEITLMPKKTNSVVLSIYQYSIFSGDQLTIQDTDRHTIGLIGYGVFKDEKKSMISNGKMVITYTRNSTSHQASGFQFTFTQVDGYPCLWNEFQCKNNKCIMKEFVCDGHNHCGDNSDQIDCVPRPTATPTQPSVDHSYTRLRMWTLVIGIPAIVICLIIVGLSVVLIRKTIKKKSENSSEPPNNNVALQTVSSSVPPNNGQNLATSEIQRASTEVPQNATLYDRFRRSIRRHKDVDANNAPTDQKTYQIPSMYPSLDQVPSAPEMNGTDNPSFTN